MAVTTLYPSGEAQVYTVGGTVSTASYVALSRQVISEEGIASVGMLGAPDQAWFWTREWQQGEREVDEAIASGDLSEVFTSAEDLFADLDRA